MLIPSVKKECDKKVDVDQICLKIAALVHFILGLISCSVEYLHFGGRKAAMLKAAMLKGKKDSRPEVFFITDYPNMI
ncbi:MAG: hypothetical protein F6K17_23200 [Okeania sp. SIO3C4]|nr:hypothetical protein [Okeania sp. SIO3C4]